MIARTRGTGEFMAACIGAVFVAGIIYVGILLLNDAPVPEGMEVVDGAIRLAQPREERAKPELQRRKLEETKPPEKLPKTFSTRAKNRPAKPRMQLSAPAFSADMRPGLMGDIAIPSGDFGSVGFNLDEVDDVPRAVRSVPPDYPYVAKRNRTEGSVVIRMLVTADGEPRNLSVHEANPAGVFEKAALSAARRWRFKPGRYKGKNVDTWVLLPFEFELTP